MTRTAVRAWCFHTSHYYINYGAERAAENQCTANTRMLSATELRQVCRTPSHRDPTELALQLLRVTH